MMPPRTPTSAQSAPSPLHPYPTPTSRSASPAPPRQPPHYNTASASAPPRLRLRPIATPRGRAHPESRSARTTPKTPHLSTGTPPKHKLSCADDEHRLEPSSKRISRSASVVTTLMQEELRRAVFSSGGFFQDFLFNGGNGIGCGDAIMKSLCEANQVKGLSWNEVARAYFCDPPDFADGGFSEWFCGFANAVAACALPVATAEMPGTLHTPLATPLATPPGTTPLATPGPIQVAATAANLLAHPVPTWVVTRNKTLSGVHNDRRRPDFALFSFPPATAADFTWRDILIVGEHQSKRTSIKASFMQLSCYAEQVFIAQPFRNAVLGILTMNTNPWFEVWRFDRAGALGSFETTYWTGEGLNTLVCALREMSTGMSGQRMGFRTQGIQWGVGRNPVDEASLVSAPLQGMTLQYNHLVFCAKGIVSRGTRVWTATMNNEAEVAIKECWRSIGRDSEAHLYAVAGARGVQGLPMVLYHDTYEDVRTGVRHGHIPTPKPTATSTDPATAKYPAYIAAHDRVFSRLVLNQVGLSINTPSLSPLAIARSLLAAVIGHASLFFTGQILHRDLSPYNILAFPNGVSNPLPLGRSSPPGLYGRQTALHGTLIDLDYALDMSKPGAQSGAKDRTGTYPFLAIALLSGRVSHRYRHDLESLLYVLLYVALYPRPPRPDDEDSDYDTDNTDAGAGPWDTRHPLKLWFNPAEKIVAAVKKSAIVGDKAEFEALFEHFRPGFGGFADAAGRMRMALWALGTGTVAGGACVFLPEGPPVAAPGRGEGRHHRRKTKTKGKGKAKGRAGEVDGPRSWLHPDEVRVGVSNWMAYLEVREALEDLVDWCVAAEEEGSELGGFAFEEEGSGESGESGSSGEEDRDDEAGEE